MARIAAIGRRKREENSYREIGECASTSTVAIRKSRDSRLPLPGAMRRILEFLAMNSGRRVTKTQVFNFIYGVFDEDVEENVVESHISKLRKKLRERLGHDPIESKRFLGYRLVS